MSLTLNKFFRKYEHYKNRNNLTFFLEYFSPEFWLVTVTHIYTCLKAKKNYPSTGKAYDTTFKTTLFCRNIKKKRKTSDINLLQPIQFLLQKKRRMLYRATLRSPDFPVQCFHYQFKDLMKKIGKNKKQIC